MDRDYHQEFMICGEDKIESNKVYVPKYSKKSKESPGHGEPCQNSNTENPYKDWESNTEPKDLEENYNFGLKEVICMSNDTSNQRIESTTTRSETKDTDPKKIATNLEENWNDTKHRQVWTQQILL